MDHLLIANLLVATCPKRRSEIFLAIFLWNFLMITCLTFHSLFLCQQELLANGRKYGTSATCFHNGGNHVRCIKYCSGLVDMVKDLSPRQKTWHTNLMSLWLKVRDVSKVVRDKVIALLTNNSINCSTETFYTFLILKGSLVVQALCRHWCVSAWCLICWGT